MLYLKDAENNVTAKNRIIMYFKILSILINEILSTFPILEHIFLNKYLVSTKLFFFTVYTNIFRDFLDLYIFLLIRFFLINAYI